MQEGELADAQAYLTGSFPLTIETPSAIALQVLNAVFYGLDLNDLQTYRERVNAITPDDIQRVAKSTCGPIDCRSSSSATRRRSPSSLPAWASISSKRSRSPISISGSADLKRHGPPTNRFQPAAFKTPPAVLQSPAVASAGPAHQDRQQAVRDLIARAVQAKGGLDRLRSIRTVKATATTTMAGGARRSGDVRHHLVHPISGFVPRRREDGVGRGRARCSTAASAG